VQLPLPGAERRPASAVNDGVDGHDRAGKFVPGNRCGKGNVAYRLCSERRATFLSAVTNEDILAVAAKLKEQALGGDNVSAKLLLEYSVGRPLPAPDADPEADEVRRRLAWPAVVEVALAALDFLTPQAALEFLRAAEGGKHAGLDSPLDVPRAACLADLRRQVLAARAGKT
jgi:hypothetical protein